MSDVIRRLAADDPNDRETWAGTATVTNTLAGTAPDGRKLISVEWRGATVNCAYLATYTPALGHKVAFIKDGSSMLVLGRPAT